MPARKTTPKKNASKARAGARARPDENMRWMPEVSSSGELFLRRREIDGEGTPVGPGSMNYPFSQGLTFVARRLQAGSRLRLIVAPLNTLYSEKNYNSGGVVAEETGKDARTVTATLYHDAEHPSALYLPIAASVAEKKKK